MLATFVPVAVTARWQRIIPLPASVLFRVRQRLPIGSSQAAAEIRHDTGLTAWTSNNTVFRFLRLMRLAPRLTLVLVQMNGCSRSFTVLSKIISKFHQPAMRADASPTSLPARLAVIVELQGRDTDAGERPGACKPERSHVGDRGVIGNVDDPPLGPKAARTTSRPSSNSTSGRCQTSSRRTTEAASVGRESSYGIG